jgi:hypothetical protein
MSESTYTPQEASKLIDQETSTKLSPQIKLVPDLNYPTYSPSEAHSLINDKGILDTNRPIPKRVKFQDRGEDEDIEHVEHKKGKKHSRKR